MSPELPLVVTAAWWFHGWLRGAASLDEVQDHLTVHAAVHTLAASGSTRTPHAADGIVDALGALRLAGADGVACALPVPGDPAGLRGPRELTQDAVDAGGVLLGLGTTLAFVPELIGSGCVWHPRTAAPRPPSDLGETDRHLRHTLLETERRLAELDVASWSPDATDALLNAHRTPGLTAPTSTPTAAVDLAQRAWHLLHVVGLAVEDGIGGAVSAHEAAARQDALDVLEKAARHALQAAASPDAWPVP